MLRMGQCLGTEVTEEEKKARIHSAKIDRDLYECAKREMNVVKILLLGETGKRTHLYRSAVPVFTHGSWFHITPG